MLCLALIVSPLGRIRLGGPEATPDFSLTGWFAMLFSAGMGIGLKFYGVSEPLGHFEAALGGPVTEGGVRTDWAPLGGAVDDPEAARRLGMAATIFHWGLHPWAIYAIVALALGLFAYNKGLPLTLRSVFFPIFGERIWGWPGHIIDILAVLATIFGLATSLGLGAERAMAGLAYLFGFQNTGLNKILLIVGITFVAGASVVLGVERAIKRLSELNMILAIVLLIFVIAVGPTMAILGGFFSNLGAYGAELIPLSNPFGRTDDNFSQGWTGFYWAWWISWSPFVGMFIARVSRGRSVREFLAAVLLVPSLVSVLWMTAFGGTAHRPDRQRFLGHPGCAAGTGAVHHAGAAASGFHHLAGGDRAGDRVLRDLVGQRIAGHRHDRGGRQDQRPRPAAHLLGRHRGGGRHRPAGGRRPAAALQAMAVSTGFPFAIVLLGACYALVKGLMAEHRELR